MAAKKVTQWTATSRPVAKIPTLTLGVITGRLEPRNPIHRYRPPAPINVRQNTSGVAESEINFPRTPVKPNTNTVACKVIWA